MKTLLEVINDETSDIEKEAAISAHAHFLSARHWEKMNLWFGIPSVGLAAIASVTAFTDLPSFVTGGVAITVAGLTAVNTYLNPSEKATSHGKASSAFKEIRRKASLLRDVDAQLLKDDDEETAASLADRLRELTTEITQVDQNAPGITTSAKEKAEIKFHNQFEEEKAALPSPQKQAT